MTADWRQEDDAAVALAYRLWLCAGAGVPVDVARVTRRLGVVVTVRPAPGGVRAVLIYTRRHPLIVVNAMLPLVSQRYAVAHEITHLLMDRGLLPVRLPRRERICQRCAANLLMPPHLVAAAHHAFLEQRHGQEEEFTPDLDLLSELAGHFVVSRAAMTIQLRALRLLPPLAHRQAATSEQLAAACAPFDALLTADLQPLRRCHAHRARHLLPPPAQAAACTRCPLAGGCPLPADVREGLWRG